MTVYVYKLRGQSPLGARTRPPPWYGLTSDDESELHDLAAGLGIRRDLYHPRAIGPQQLQVVGHYDLTQGERERALAKAARPITARQEAKLRRQWAAELGIS